MRAYLLIALLVGLVAISAGQQRAVRGRIRSLIKAARGGDPEAKQTLRNLRERLLRNRNEKASRIPVDTPKQQETVLIARPIFNPQQQTIVESEPIVNNGIPEIPRAPKIPLNIVTEENVESRRAQPVSKTRAQTRPLLPNLSEFEPHRAVNTGLEVGSRSELSANIRVTNRTKTPPIRTIRRYSYFDEQGNYIFGYEAEDGSFKEKKRGLDCVVNGKYGYVDPDGILREYTYVSGNQCDPNAVSVDGEVEPLPLNHQYQRLTTEKRLSHAEAEKLIDQFKSRPAFERKRHPVGSIKKTPQQSLKLSQQIPQRTQQFPQIKQQLPQRTQQFPKIKQQLPQRTQQFSQRNQKSSQQIQQSSKRIKQSQQQNRLQFSEPRAINPQRNRKPSSQSVLPPFKFPEVKSFPKIEKIPQKKIISQSIPTPPPSPFHQVTTKRGEILNKHTIQSFTTFRPPLSSFSFNNDFDEVFSNFRTRQRTRPSQVSRKPATQRPTTPPVFKAPKLSPIPSTPSLSPKSSHQQLVFDATSGTFRSISIDQLANAKHIGSLQIPAGRPLPIAKKANSVSTSQRTSALSPQQINDLFSHFRIPV